jgi:glutamate-1-semialdehyde 2,1-aminomutase
MAASGTVRFTNSGTEAAMLAVKLARRHTGRPLVLKAWAGYHGSYDDLEAGLADRGEAPGRVILADFGDLSSFREAIVKHGDVLAAVILEPVMFTGVVAAPPPDFLRGVQAAAAEVGALFILDDCLMLRLAVGGSRERFTLDEPDLTVLGKFLGGGLPVGAVTGRPEVMNGLDPRQPGCLYHGGSFNGNPLGMVAGATAMRELTAPRIAVMEDLTAQLRERILSSAGRHGVTLSAAGFGSVFGIYTADEPPTPAKGRPSEAMWLELHLALLNNGLYVGTEGEISLSTVFSEATLEEAASRFDRAFDEFKSLGRFS